MLTLKFDKSITFLTKRTLKMCCHDNVERSIHYILAPKDYLYMFRKGHERSRKNNLELRFRNQREEYPPPLPPNVIGLMVLSLTLHDTQIPPPFFTLLSAKILILFSCIGIQYSIYWLSSGTQFWWYYFYPL